MANRVWTNSLQHRSRHLQIRPGWQYLIVFLVVMLTTLILFTVRREIEETKLSLVYLVIVLCCAVVAHPGVTFFCGLLSFLTYDFFLVPPVFTLRFAQPVQVLDPLAFLVVAVVTGTIAERARQHANEKIAYQKADQLRGTLLNLVSHNLRTPLATIKTALTTLLADNTLNSENRQLLTYADQEVDHLNRLVANVLQVSRLEASAIRINKRWDALDEVITSVLSRWPQETSEGSLTADLAATPALVLFDFELIEAVLTNLVDNALRHGKPPVKVIVTTHPEEIRVSVEDAGPGVHVQDRARLFDKFYNAKSRGIGLGLAVCKGLVEAHGGQIWAEFTATTTRFVLTLPLVVNAEFED